MKHAPAEAKVLVATDNADDARQICRQLESDFENVHTSTDPDRAVPDFDEFAPDVLVLAFDSLDKAQRYYLGLYRHGASLQRNPHRTVILCDKDEVRAVFELCKQEYFDDYVLYWPHTHDGPRLAMSIWSACREMAALHSRAPSPAELFAHARHVAELEGIVSREFAEAEDRSASALRSVETAADEIAGSIDAFSDRLGSDLAAGHLDIEDGDALALAIRELKERQVALTREAGASGAASMAAWTRRFKEAIEPSLAGTRPLAEKLQSLRPVVMVVEDDEFARQLIGRTLEPEHWVTVFAGDGPAALAQLRRVKPDVILMDIRLPGMDGLALTRRLKQSPQLAAIPVIVMTGDARKEMLVSSMGAGAAAFVVKPFTRDSLTTKIQKVLSL